MPFVGRNFRPAPQVAPLASEPESYKQFIGSPAPTVKPLAGFDDEAEISRTAPQPRSRAAKDPVIAAAPVDPLSKSHSRSHPLMGKVSVKDWDVNPYQVARGIGIAK